MGIDRNQWKPRWGNGKKSEKEVLQWPWGCDGDGDCLVELRRQRFVNRWRGMGMWSIAGRECEQSSVGMWRIGWNAKCRRRGVGDEESASWRGEVWRREGRRTESSSMATESSAVEGTMTMTMASSGDGDKRRAQATATWDGSTSSGDDKLGLVERVMERERIGWVRERMGSEKKKKKKKRKKKGLNLIFSVKLIVTTYISSLLATFSDKI